MFYGRAARVESTLQAVAGEHFWRRRWRVPRTAGRSDEAFPTTRHHHDRGATTVVICLRSEANCWDNTKRWVPLLQSLSREWASSGVFVLCSHVATRSDSGVHLDRHAPVCEMRQWTFMLQSKLEVSAHLLAALADRPSCCCGESGTAAYGKACPHAASRVQLWSLLLLLLWHALYGSQECICA
jgi:hypothetical protein